eukprot:TRINITY_DN615_c0_g7_i1.p1 TRINITY_DN615_c0_g7~~TRINITY_DN615_c0_g7_i1.p1  ORF type:complete len:1017 (-),score=207.31 TRINITY_DN615_c0_g7_i1:172-3222(-)
MAEQVGGVHGAPFIPPPLGSPPADAVPPLVTQESHILAMAGALPAMTMAAPAGSVSDVGIVHPAESPTVVAAVSGAASSVIVNGPPAIVPLAEVASAPDVPTPMEVDGATPSDATATPVPVETEAKELEEDAIHDNRPRLSQQVCIHTSDTTLNVMPSVHSNVLLPLTDGPMQFLLAGARANIGIKDGRYLFEARIVEVLNPQESQDYGPHNRQRLPQPKHVLKLGFALAGSSLFLGDDEGSICFDSEGAVTHNKTTMATVQKFTRDQVIGVMLNLEAGSANVNTVSLFRDGVRVSKPQPLPEALRGKPLFPAITFRSVSVQVNFGPTRMAQLPFVCRTLQEAAHSDVVMLQDPKPADGNYEVLFPICLPDEGTFDWLDMFLEKHPDYIELSDRMLLDWAEKSGITRPQINVSSNDKPDMHFGIPQIDEDMSLRRVLTVVAPVQRRNMVVMEVKGNLMKDERHEFLKRFSMSHFRKVAKVLIGEPTRDFKERSNSILLKDKQTRADAEWKVRKSQEREQKLIEQRQKELDRERRRIDRQVEKAAAEAARKEEEERKALAGEKGQGEEQKEDKMNVDKESEKKAENDDEDDKVEEVKDVEECEPPPVELTEEEKQRWFRKPAISDLTMPVLAAHFTSFTIPRREEGFDDVQFDWQKQAASIEYVKGWIKEKKITTRVEDITPSDWFRGEWSRWQGQLQKWHQKQNEWKDPARIAAAAVTAKQEGKEMIVDTEKKDEETNDGDSKETNLDAAKEQAQVKKTDWLAVEEEDDLDVFGVTDVCNINTAGEPLFSNFAFEDWALLSLRYELHLLVHAFRRDAEDPERSGIYQEHLPFYYNRYFKKAFNTRYYGVDTYTALVDFIRDTVDIDPISLVLESHIDVELDNFDVFLKLTEESRRYRQLRLDAGEKLPPLDFSKPQPPTQAVASAGAGVGGNPRPYDQHKGYNRHGTKGPPTGKGYGPPAGKGGGYGGFGGGAPKGGGGYYGKAYPNQGKGGYTPQQAYGQRRPHSGPYGKGTYGK